ncbi:phage baseplate assembly protein V [Derxia gummosa]|uniref:Phage baseplate assembly protein V n=1 Tax=Derxia gummosa DSM 723 TaxID=1121388 RepID=A0A8B6X930_9BURK|nr:phage baseplate assembly protein V [Derxia gummosa]
MSNDRLVARMLAPLVRRVGNLLARGVLTGSSTADGLPRAQARLLADETRDALDDLERYGLASAPLPGAEVLAAFVDGDRAHGVVLAIADRRYRIPLDAGEVALYDDLGQSVHLTRDGIVVRGAGQPMLITDTPTLTVDAAMHVTGAITCDAAVSALGDITSAANIGAAGNVTDQDGAHSMAGMRTLYDGHHHTITGVRAGTDSVTTDPPTEQS